jgi:hypothetical protein
LINDYEGIFREKEDLKENEDLKEIKWSIFDFPIYKSMVFWIFVGKIVIFGIIFIFINKLDLKESGFK